MNAGLIFILNNNKKKIFKKKHNFTSFHATKCAL